VNSTVASHAQRRGTRRGAATLALVALATVVGSIPTGARAADSGQSGSGLHIVGTLPKRTAGVTDPSELIFGPFGRRLYREHAIDSEAWIAEYDLGTTIPTLIRDVPSGLSSGVFTAYGSGVDDITYDARRSLAYKIVSGTTGPVIYPLDLTTLQFQPSWDLSSVLPGMAPTGITYSAADDRIYIGGDLKGGVVVQEFSNAIVYPVGTVAALDPTTRQLAWIDPIQHCPRLMETFGQGSVVARSVDQPYIYVACWTASADWGQGVVPQIPGSATVVRLTVSPTATQQQILTLPQEAFPISGSFLNGSGFTTGIGIFDYGSDRFYLVSQSLATPGAWVLDGHAPGWAGFVAAPASDDVWTGVNSGNGHFYLGGSGGTSPADWLLATAGRQTPVPQGEVMQGSRTGPFQTVSAAILADPLSRRVFVTDDSRPIGRGPSDPFTTFVIEDDTPDPPALLPPDFDRATADVPEGAGTSATFAGHVAAFGSRVLAVGASNPVCTTVSGANGCVFLGTNLGDRGVYAARVAGGDLSGLDSSASAQALSTDAQTASQVQNATGQVSGTVGGAGGDSAAPVLDAATWAWPATTCLDASQHKAAMESSTAGARSQVTCDLAAQSTTAESHFGGIGVPGVSVASSDAVTSTVRTATQGTLTTTSASASGVRLSSPGGTVSIGQVVATATAQAHGRVGTAAATWTRQLDQVVIQDASGNVVAKCAHSDSTPTDPCNLQRLIDLMNDVLTARVLVTLPQPAVDQTPRGAFAEVRKSDADFHNDEVAYDDSLPSVPALQIVTFADNDSRSRNVVQLASIEASSIYQIHPAFADSAGGDGGGAAALLPPTPDSGTLPLPAVADTGATPASTQPAGTPGTAPAVSTAPVSLADSLGFLLRSPAETLLLLGFWALVMTGPLSIWRRRSLVRTLQKPPGG